MQENVAHNLSEKDRTKDVIIEENVTFSSLLLSTNIKDGLLHSGFKKPSPIQFKAIPLGRCGFDLIVKSKSGTGKTLVFTTIALEAVNLSNNHLQVLILVPTREIAVQIQDVLCKIGHYIKGVNIQSFIGGLPLEDDIKKANGCHIAVGAPGRVKHLINLGALPTKFVKLFVLDEADKLMESTFKTDINDIYDSLPQRKQIIAASATYPRELDHFLANYMLSPTHVTSENETPLLLGLKQFAAILKSTTINAVQQMKAKNEILVDVLSKVSFTQCLVFTNYQTRTESVCNYLNQKGWTASFISAAVEQSERLEAIKNLKNFKSRILLSTDLTSRGIDASNVDLVINYDLPHDAVTYLHRMGRAGRYGSPGICINFASEGTELRKLELILGTIGSTNLSISKLPELDGVDLWKVDPTALEQIWGVVPTDASNELSENIKKEVLTMKQTNKKECHKKKGSKNDKKKIKLEESVEHILRKKEMEAEDHLGASDFDTETLLNSLIIGDKDDNKKRKRSTVNNDIDLDQLVDVKYVENILLEKTKEESDFDSPKLDAENILKSLVCKDEENSSDVIVDEENKQSVSSAKIHNTNITFARNKSLLNITKILCGNKVQIDKDMVKSINEHLTYLKDENFESDYAASIEKILQPRDIKSEKNITKSDCTNVTEDVFQIGYQCAINNNKSWLNCLPEDELHRFQEFNRGEHISISSDEENVEEEEELYEEDYEMEENVSEIENNEASGVTLQWVPVVRNAEPNSEYFENCYEDCNTVLWQNGLSFETVDEFDNWFYQWQGQLQSVRNYVQQNIYVDEMSKYQQNRQSNK